MVSAPRVYFPLTTHSLPTHYPLTIHPLPLTTRSLPTHSDCHTCSPRRLLTLIVPLPLPLTLALPLTLTLPLSQARWQAEALADEADVAAARAELDAEVDSPPG